MKRFGLLMLSVMVAGTATRAHAQCCNTIEFVEPVTCVEYLPTEIVWQPPIVEWVTYYPTTMATEVTMTGEVWNAPVFEYAVNPCECVCTETILSTGKIVSETNLGAVNTSSEIPSQNMANGEVLLSPSATYTKTSPSKVEPVAPDNETVRPEDDRDSLDASEDEHSDELVDDDEDDEDDFDDN